MAQLDGWQRHPRTPKSPTIEQLLRANEPEKWSPLSSPIGKENDMEYDPSSSQKKSVLTKVKEKAKKWRHNLSKKKPVEGENTTPSWGVNLEDEEEEEEDPEYLGAPMYESELAPEGYRETARQHPRVVPVIAEKHVLASSVRFGGEQEQERPSRIEKNNTKTTNAVNSKLQTLAVSTAGSNVNTYHETEKLVLQESHKSAAQETGDLEVKTSPKEKSSPTEYIWDKGISMKDYMVQKFQPGEDEKALSQIISEAMSPSKGSGHVGLVGKVKGAVSSWLWSEGYDQAKDVPTPTASSPQIPISTNAHEVVEEEIHGRILQAN